MTEDAVHRGYPGNSPEDSRNFSLRPLRSLAAAAVASVVLLSGCGDFFNPPGTGTGTGTGSGDYLYVANAGSANSVGVVQITSGVFTKPSASPYSVVDGAPSALAITPKSTFLYVASSVLNTGIYEYSINSDGSLTAQNSGNPLAVATNLTPSAMVVDPTGAWLIAFQTVSGGGTTATVFSINASTGALSNPNNILDQLTIDSGSVGQVVFNPAGTVLYATLGAPISGTANSGGIDILGFVPTTGALSKTGNVQPLGSADIGVAINTSGTFLFATETGAVASGANGVRSFSIGSAGLLTAVGAYATDLGAGAVLVDSTGDYLYVANRTAGTITAFSISSATGTAGTLTQIGTAGISTVGTAPVAMVEDNSNTYLAVVCSGGSPDVQLFTFDATTAGQLDPLTGGAILTGGTVNPADAVAIVATH